MISHDNSYDKYHVLFHTKHDDNEVIIPQKAKSGKVADSPE